MITDDIKKQLAETALISLFEFTGDTRNRCANRLVDAVITQGGIHVEPSLWLEAYYFRALYLQVISLTDFRELAYVHYNLALEVYKLALTDNGSVCHDE